MDDIASSLEAQIDRRSNLIWGNCLHLRCCRLLSAKYKYVQHRNMATFPNGSNIRCYLPLFCNGLPTTFPKRPSQLYGYSDDQSGSVSPLPSGGRSSDPFRAPVGPGISHAQRPGSSSSASPYIPDYVSDAGIRLDVRETERATSYHAVGSHNMLRNLAWDERRTSSTFHPCKNSAFEARPIIERVFPVSGSGDSLRFATGSVDQTPPATQSSARLRTSRPGIWASADKATHVGSRPNAHGTDTENAGDRRDVPTHAVYELPEICRLDPYSTAKIVGSKIVIARRSQ